MRIQHVKSEPDKRVRTSPGLRIVSWISRSTKVFELGSMDILHTIILAVMNEVRIMLS